MKRARSWLPATYALCGVIWFLCGLLTPSWLGWLQIVSGIATLAIGVVERWARPTLQQELFRRVRDHLDAFLDHCEGGDLPSENSAKRLWVDVNNACGDAVDHSKEKNL